MYVLIFSLFTLYFLANLQKGYRRVTLRYPRDFVTIGKLFPKIRRPHTIGTLNMASTFFIL
jgi:hypothetical protein